MGLETEFLAQIVVEILAHIRGLESNGARLKRIAGCGS
jgi:hypothetical protein